MADTSVKLSGTYDSIEAYNILEEMRNMSSDYEEIRTEAAAAASAATAAVTTAQTAANSASTYAGNAQTYAVNANTSAGEAAGYASDASTSATNAASSETNASNSATAAAASAANAAASEAVVAGALPLTGGTITGDLNVTGTLKKSGNNVVTSNFSTFTVSKTTNMLELSVQQSIRMGNLAIVSFSGQLTSTKGAWTDTDIMTLPVTTSGTTYDVGLTNNGTSVLLQVANNKVTYRTLNHAVNDDTIRGLLVFPIT